MEIDHSEMFLTYIWNIIFWPFLWRANACKISVLKKILTPLVFLILAY